MSGAPTTRPRPDAAGPATSADAGWLTHRVTFTPTFEDVLAAYRLAARARLRWIMAGYVVLILGFEVWIGAFTGSWTDGLLFAVTVIGILLAILLLIPRSVRRRIRRIHAQQLNLRSELTVSWDAAGLHTVALTGTSDLPWSAYLRRREDDTSILLYQSDVLYQFIPRRVLTPAHLATLRPLIAPIRRAR